MSKTKQKLAVRRNDVMSKKTFIFCGTFFAWKEGKYHCVCDIYGVRATRLATAKADAHALALADAKITFPESEGFSHHSAMIGTNLTDKIELTEEGKEWITLTRQTASQKSQKNPKK